MTDDTNDTTIDDPRVNGDGVPPDEIPPLPAGASDDGSDGSDDTAVADDQPDPEATTPDPSDG